VVLVDERDEGGLVSGPQRLDDPAVFRRGVDAVRIRPVCSLVDGHRTAASSAREDGVRPMLTEPNAARTDAAG
jgi:hypothetical protein